MKLLSAISNLFRNPAATVAPEAPAAGVIASASCELFTVKLRHEGGDRYTLLLSGNYTGSITGRFIRGTARAMSLYKTECAVYGAK